MNHTKHETLHDFCKTVGLYFCIWSPGDGVTRYRFDRKPISFFQADGIVTVKGFKAAEAFVEAYKMGYHASRQAKKADL